MRSIHTMGDGESDLLDLIEDLDGGGDSHRTPRKAPQAATTAEASSAVKEEGGSEAGEGTGMQTPTPRKRASAEDL